ncbi:hypothetical protein BJ981_005197 [Sphaerisporangium krabiense]|uniref:Uncharacterized protein n=1 Tax=Sphaerisporangium krabiense TaxID=763782 RepID=A0A7W9DSG8_9ACTN|nr:hypothetical protein [Sphaerisporangium krabiense]
MRVGRKAHIDREELRRLVASGRSNAELAAHFGVTESGILQAKRLAGLAKPMMDHGRALPWKLNRAHNQSGPATNLRNLSAIAQGGQVPQTKINTALRWARRLTDSGLDVGYSYEDGFYERPAEGTSHIETVLTAALSALHEHEHEEGRG